MLSAIKRMEGLARMDKDIISFSQGIPFLYSAETIRTSVKRALEQNCVDKYSDPQGIVELRQAISENLASDGMSYSLAEIIVTSGAVEAMASALLSLTNPGDEILIPTPTYSSFFAIANVARLQIIPLSLREDQAWSLDRNELKQKITAKTKAIILCNPNNPTGSVYTKEELQEICELAVEHNFLILLDEVYGNMVYTEEKLFQVCANSAYRKQIVRIVSFSKDFSLTGWRVGFLHTDTSHIEKILAVHDAVVNCAPVIAQYAALAALSLPTIYLQEKRQLYKKNRDLMGNYLVKLQGAMTFRYPLGTYFFFPKLNDTIQSHELCMDIIKLAKVAIVPGDDFGLGGAGHVRLCFGRKPEEIREGMERLVQYFNNR